MTSIFAESMSTEVAALAAIAAPIIGGLASVVAYLYHREQQCQTSMRKLERKVQAADDDVIKLTVLVEQMQWSGDLTIHGEVVVNAHNGNIETWNPAATALLGWSRSDMQGKPLTKIIPERFREKHLEAMRRLIQSGSAPKSGPFNLVALKKDGSETCIEATYSGWHDTDSGDYLVGAVLKKSTRRLGPNTDSWKPSAEQSPTPS